MLPNNSVLCVRVAATISNYKVVLPRTKSSFSAVLELNYFPILSSYNFIAYYLVYVVIGVV
jgi:hypothetical protein